MVENLLVARVAPEELVGSLASQHDLHPGLARQTANEVERDTDGVGERLILVVHQVTEESERVLLGDYDLVVVSAEVHGDSARLGALVEPRRVQKADREGRKPACALSEERDESRPGE